MCLVQILLVVLAQLPSLHFESPVELAPIRAQLESINTTRWGDISRLIGVSDVGRPVRIVLETESSNLARNVPPWISGFAVEREDTVVIFPARAPSYPDDTLEDVLRHEVAHVLIGHAAAGNPVPRWFDEGLAMEAERERRFRDQTQLLYQLVTGTRADLIELDRLFTGGQQDQERAYAIAGSLVHELRQQYGSTIGAQILSRVRTGSSFDAAFSAETGVTPQLFETHFWEGQRIWTAWVPILTSSAVLWPGITLLALLAIYMRHRRNREIEKRWEEEDGES
jgi:hypothetical protein